MGAIGPIIIRDVPEPEPEPVTGRFLTQPEKTGTAGFYACRFLCLPVFAISTKLSSYRQLGGHSTSSKFQVNRTSRFETAADARNPIQATVGQQF